MVIKKQDISNAASDRLLEMLSKLDEYPVQRRGLCAFIQARLDAYSYATVHKWLYQNSLPRTPEERLHVSNSLNVDLLYWEYGISETGTRDAVLEPIFFIKHSNEVQKQLALLGYDASTITEDILLKIQNISIQVGQKCLEPEPDASLIREIIEIVLYTVRKSA